MNIKTIIIAVLAILFVTLAAILVYLLASTEVEEGPEAGLSTLSVLETGTAGDHAYTVYNYRGAGNLTILSYPSEQKRRLVIINDSQAIDAERFGELVDSLKELEKYGYSVEVSGEPKIGNGIYVIPTGALPSYALFNLQTNSSNGTIVYIGAKDLLISNGVKQLNWYSSLEPGQRKRVVQYNGTLDEFLEEGNVSLSRDILLGSWMAQNSTTYRLSGNGVRTAVVPLNKTGFIRLIYEFRDHYGVYDSPYLQTTEQIIVPKPAEIYPWEKSSLQFLLNKTNGTAFFSVKKDGKVVEHEQLRRVTDENVFIRKLEYPEPGEYLLVVDDNDGIIATGLLHIRDIQVKLREKRGYTYVFSVTVDDKPLTNSEALVSAGNSSKRRYFISDGTMVINAKLDKGENVLDMEIGEAKIPLTVVNNDEPLIEFYLKYGIPAVGIVALVYFGARISRRPTYSLRFGESVSSIRQEMPLPVDRAIEGFQMIRNDMKLGNSPITPQEFTIALKRYLTNGADVTEGNVEEILTKLVKAGRLESHRDYYQLRGEGDIVKNSLRRMIREKLIESGTMFRESDGKFVTKEFEIGFFGQKFDSKAVVVVDDKAEEKSLLSSLEERALARVKIMQSNDTLSIVPIDRLSDIL